MVQLSNKMGVYRANVNTHYPQVVVQEKILTVGRGDGIGVRVIIPRPEVEPEDTEPREGATYTGVDTPSVPPGDTVTVTVGVTIVVTVSQLKLETKVTEVTHSTDVTGAGADE